jgi:hypothetical protein
LAEATADKNPTDENVMPTEAALAVNEVIEQCRMYLRGERQQGVLFSEGDKTPTAEEWCHDEQRRTLPASQSMRTESDGLYHAGHRQDE